MTSSSHFPEWSGDVWTHLDHCDDPTEWAETPSEREAFELAVANEVRNKFAPPGGPPLASSSQRPASAPVVIEATPLPASSPPRSSPTPGPSRTVSTPTRTTISNLTAPYVATPSLTAPLPDPPRLPLPNVLNTPDNVPTPQTPGDISIGRGRRDDPATPVPLGTAALDKLKGKKEFQKLTAHFSTMNQALQAVQPVAARGRGRGRGRGSSLGMRGRGTTLIGGQVFKGLRFCIPHDPKSKNRGEIHGGQVVLHPDTAITHVIEDSGQSASTLAQRLGLQALSDLPEGTVCVKWGWVVACKMSGKMLDTTQWLSFPPTTFTRSASSRSGRMTDITDQFRSGSRAIRRKRDHTPSDSETESSERPQRRMTNAQRIIAGFQVGGLPPRPMLRSPGSNALRPVKTAPARTTPAAADEADADRIATRHDLPGGPGWIEAQGSEQDGLDLLIDGIKEGRYTDEVSDSGSEDDMGNPSSMADRFQCGKKNEGARRHGPNEWLAVEFDKLHDLYEGVQGKNDFAIRGYQKAAGILRRTEFPIKSGAHARENLRFIGENLAARIDEFISGAPGRAFYEDTPEARTVAMFKDIYGVGKNFANVLYRRGARTIDDLKTKEFGLTAGQKLGVKLYDDLISRIPRDECRQLFESIRDAAYDIDPKLWIEIMGSYRRGQADSGDVDILITRDTSDGITHAGVLKRLIHSLHQEGVITHDLSTPHDYYGLEAKWMGVGRVAPAAKYRRIDILTIPFDQWGAALIYFTGNEVFNRSLRLYARKKGYSLNQRGLYRGIIRDRKGMKMTEGEIVASRTEQEIFDVLGIRWRPPHHRRP